MDARPPATRIGHERGSALVIGSDDEFRRALVEELAALPLSVTVAPSLRELAGTVASGPRRPRVLLVPESEIDPETLEQTLCELRVRSGASQIAPIVFGRRPSPERRDVLRRAGLELALFGRFGRHALRFQVNRALAPGQRRALRGELRAPMEWRTRVFADGREKQVRCYSLSTTGGYFVTPRPWVVGSRVALELPSSQPGRFVIDGRIVYTHAAGSEAEKSLPRGMAVAFGRLDTDLEDVIRRGVSACASALRI